MVIKYIIFVDHSIYTGNLGGICISFSGIFCFHKGKRSKMNTKFSHMTDEDFLDMAKYHAKSDFELELLERLLVAKESFDILYDEMEKLPATSTD
jgi:hypothetical protein